MSCNMVTGVFKCFKDFYYAYISIHIPTCTYICTLLTKGEVQAFIRRTRLQSERHRFR